MSFRRRRRRRVAVAVVVVVDDDVVVVAAAEVVFILVVEVLRHFSACTTAREKCQEPVEVEVDLERPRRAVKGQGFEGVLLILSPCALPLAAPPPARSASPAWRTGGRRLLPRRREQHGGARVPVQHGAVLGGARRASCGAGAVMYTEPLWLGDVVAVLAGRVGGAARRSRWQPGAYLAPGLALDSLPRARARGSSARLGRGAGPRTRARPPCRPRRGRRRGAALRRGAACEALAGSARRA